MIRDFIDVSDLDLLFNIRDLLTDPLIRSRTADSSLRINDCVCIDDSFASSRIKLGRLIDPFRLNRLFFIFGDADLLKGCFLFDSL